MQWYYAESGKQVGPLTESDIEQLVVQGRINDQTLVWRQGMKEWQAYGAVKQAAAPSAAEAAVSEAGTARCRECQRIYPVGDMVQYQDAWICAGCKPSFFQRIQEGTAGGNTPVTQLKAAALTSLHGSWGVAIGVYLVAQIISSACGAIPYAGYVLQLLLAPPLALGMAVFFIALSRGTEREFGMLFQGFNQFGKAVGAYVVMTIYIMLWFLLLVIPGLIAAYRYQMVFYILADHPEVGIMESLRLSRQMMHGRKWKLFVLNLSFIGWYFLCMLPVMLAFAMAGATNSPAWMLLSVFAVPGFIFLGPYVQTATACFYNDVRDRIVIASGNSGG